MVRMPERYREWLPGARDLPGVLLVAAVFWALGHTGFSLSSLPVPQTVPVSLAAGFAIAAYLIWGYRFWVGIFLGAMAVALESGASYSFALAAGVVSAVGNLVGAYLMREWAGVRNSLDRLRDVFALLLFGVLVGRLVATGITIANLWLTGMLHGDQWLATYFFRGIGGGIGVLIATPFLLAFSEPRKQPLTRASALEALGILLLLSITGVLVFSLLVPPQERDTLAYLLIPFVIWAAIRFEMRGAAAASLLVLGITLLASARGYGAFAGGPRQHLYTALFNIVTAITSLIVAASSAERRHAVELRDGMELLRQVLDRMPVGVWIADREGRVASANPAAERIWGGGTAKAYPGWGAREKSSLEMRDWLLNRATGAAETAAEEKIEVRTADSSRKMLLASAMRLQDSDGRRIGAVGVYQDVTEIILAEQSLRELAAIVEQSDDIISVTDRRGVIEYVNPGFEKGTGYASEEAVGSKPNILKSGTHDMRFYANLWATILGGKPFRDVLVNRKKSGEIYYEAKTISCIRDTEGEITHFVSTGKDITERMKAEEELKRVNRVLRVLSECNQALVRANSEPDLLHGICSRIVHLGGYPMAWVGLVRADARCSIEPVASAGDRDRYLEAVRISWADNEFGRGPAGVAVRTGVAQATNDIATDPDFARWREEALARGYRAAASLPLLGEGKILGVLGLYAAEPAAFNAEEIGLLQELAEDIAFGMVSLRTRVQRDHAEEALRDYAGRLQQLSRRLIETEESERRQLARELHDRVGQNVTALTLNLAMLRGELPAETRQKLHARIEDCEALLDSTSQLIRDVMVDLRPPGLDELGLAAALREHLGRVSGRGGFSAAVKAPEAIPRLPPVTEITLFRIAQEALTNVAKHARATEVAVALESGADAVVLRIADNGRGFDTAEGAERPRTSLGLVSMRERAESIGARLRVESAPGQGTRVIVEAPGAASSPARPGLFK